MSRYCRTVVLAVAALLVIVGLPAGVPAANAATSSGRCGFFGVSDPSGLVTAPDTISGVLWGQFTADPVDDLGASLTCWLRVNGTDAPGARLTVSGILPAYQQVQITAVDGDSVEVCGQIHHLTSEGAVWCEPLSNTGVPPEPVVDAVATALGIVLDTGYLVADTVDAAKKAFVDPTLCPVLASRAPGVPGVVDIGPDGDTEITGSTKVVRYECPPYGAPDLLYEVLAGISVTRGAPLLYLVEGSVAVS
jgi:hypothetical protein